MLRNSNRISHVISLYRFKVRNMLAPVYILVDKHSLTNCERASRREDYMHLDACISLVGGWNELSLCSIVRPTTVCPNSTMAYCDRCHKTKCTARGSNIRTRQFLARDHCCSYETSGVILEVRSQSYRQAPSYIRRVDVWG